MLLTWPARVVLNLAYLHCAERIDADDLEELLADPADARPLEDEQTMKRAQLIALGGGVADG